MDEANKQQEKMVLFDSITGAIYGPNTNGVTGYVARAVAPQVSYQIGQYFKGTNGEGTAPHILAHGILAAAVSSATGNDPTTGALSAMGAEAAAPMVAKFLFGDKPISELTAEQKATVSSITSLAGLGLGATTGDVASAVNAAETGKVAVEDNAIETAWDIANVGIGAASFGYNISEGNYGAATIDGIGVVYDSVATAVPFLPAGASVALKAGRAAEATKNIIKAENFFDGAKYTEKVKMQASSGDYHSFPQSVDGFAGQGTVSKITGKDGVVRDKLEIPGSYRGKPGVFEYIREPNGNINHRLFVPK